MPSLKTYDLFISHAWRYSDDYDRFTRLLDAAPYFSYRNYSAPKDRPLVFPGSHASDTFLRALIDKKIRPVNAVVVLSGMYYYYHDWMQTEIDIACSYCKPIIAVKPWGNQTVPQQVASVADATVGWNTDSIVDTIRKHAL